MADPYNQFGGQQPSAAQMNQIGGYNGAMSGQMPQQGYGGMPMQQPPQYGGRQQPPQYGMQGPGYQQQPGFPQQQGYYPQPGMPQPGMPQPGMQQPGHMHPQAAAANPGAFDVAGLEASLGLTTQAPAPPPTTAQADPFALPGTDPFANPTPPPPAPQASPFEPPAPQASPFEPPAPQASPFEPPADPFSNPTAPTASSAASFGSTEEAEEEEEEEEGAPEQETPKEVALALGGEESKGEDKAAAPKDAPKTTILSRQDTFKYLEDLTNGSTQTKVDAARALKSLAFNANAEYKDGLIKGGVPRLLMVMITEAASVPSLEQSTSCMYSLAREHMDSKTALVKAGALRALSSLLHHESKQCQLNSCATLYAISCAGRDVCKTLAAFRPLERLTILINPGPGRTPQDDQLQLFAALLIVNLLHVKGITSKEDRATLVDSLQRAYDDASEAQVRDTIAIGLKRLSSMGSRKARLKQGISSIARKSFGASRSASSSSAAHFDNPTSAQGFGSTSPQGFGSLQSASRGSPGGSERSSAGRSRQVSNAIKGGLSSIGSGLGKLSTKGKSGYQGSDSAQWEEG